MNGKSIMNKVSNVFWGHQTQPNNLRGSPDDPDYIDVSFPPKSEVDQDYLKVSYPRWMIEKFANDLLEPGSVTPGSVKQLNGGDERNNYGGASSDAQFPSNGTSGPKSNGNGAPDKGGFMAVRAYIPGGGKLSLDGQVSDDGILKIEGSLNKPQSVRPGISYGQGGPNEGDRYISDRSANDQDGRIDGRAINNGKSRYSERERYTSDRRTNDEDEPTFRRAIGYDNRISIESERYSSDRRTNDEDEQSCRRAIGYDKRRSDEYSYDRRTNDQDEGNYRRETNYDNRRSEGNESYSSDRRTNDEDEQSCRRAIGYDKRRSDEFSYDRRTNDQDEGNYRRERNYDNRRSEGNERYSSDRRTNNGDEQIYRRKTNFDNRRSDESERYPPDRRTNEDERSFRRPIGYDNRRSTESERYFSDRRTNDEDERSCRREIHDGNNRSGEDRGSTSSDRRAKVESGQVGDSAVVPYEWGTEPSGGPSGITESDDDTLGFDEGSCDKYKDDIGCDENEDLFGCGTVRGNAFTEVNSPPRDGGDDGGHTRYCDDSEYYTEPLGFDERITPSFPSDEPGKINYITINNYITRYENGRKTVTRSETENPTNNGMSRKMLPVAFDDYMPGPWFFGSSKQKEKEPKQKKEKSAKSGSWFFGSPEQQENETEHKNENIIKYNNSSRRACSPGGASKHRNYFCERRPQSKELNPANKQNRPNCNVKKERTIQLYKSEQRAPSKYADSSKCGNCTMASRQENNHTEKETFPKEEPRQEKVCPRNGEEKRDHSNKTGGESNNSKHRKSYYCNEGYVEIGNDKYKYKESSPSPRQDPRAHCKKAKDSTSSNHENRSTEKETHHENVSPKSRDENRDNNDERGSESNKPKHRGNKGHCTEGNKKAHEKVSPESQKPNRRPCNESGSATNSSKKREPKVRFEDSSPSPDEVGITYSNKEHERKENTENVSHSAPSRLVNIQKRAQPTAAEVKQLLKYVQNTTHQDIRQIIQSDTTPTINWISTMKRCLGLIPPCASSNQER